MKLKSPNFKRGEVAAGEEVADVGLGVPVFVAVAGVADEAVVAETFQVAVFDFEEGHKGFVVNHRQWMFEEFFC